MDKVAFVVFSQGEALKDRISRLCAGYHVKLFNCPTNKEDITQLLSTATAHIGELLMVLKRSTEFRENMLVRISKSLRKWSIRVLKMKAIYHTMNKFNMDVTNKCYVAECWIPVVYLPNVQRALVRGSKFSSSIHSILNLIESKESPPTFVRTNKFTSGFQAIIDAYGTGSYREVNPALATIISFPFLFAVMFGDVGHGLLMVFAALFLIRQEDAFEVKKPTSEIYRIMYGGRYIILMMGIFSIYTGLVYNDFFSKSMNLLGSRWVVNTPQSVIMEQPAIALDPKTDAYVNPYPFGVDPIWMNASNKIIFMNSYKMKMSIIIGVIHMVFGVCNGIFNHIHFRQKFKIFLEFLPQILFLCGLFVYLGIMILMKWLLYSAKATEDRWSPSCAPSVLILFINMMLFKSTSSEANCVTYYMYPLQPLVQKVLVWLALGCIPVMLLGKPFYILSTRNNPPTKKYRKDRFSDQAIELREDVIVINEDRDEAEGPYGRSDENGDLEFRYADGNRVWEEEPLPSPFVDYDKDEDDSDNSDDKFRGEGSSPPNTESDNGPISEVFIHTAIHTVEYVLNCVSHTASYLRLWALSLAHAQLSEVLWSLMAIALKMEGWAGSVMLYFMFYIWSVFTVAILVLMEGLSAFLHTLRLHWVEFMSKFYSGLGYPFEPFYFRKIIDEEDNY